MFTIHQEVVNLSIVGAHFIHFQVIDTLLSYLWWSDPFIIHIMLSIVSYSRAMFPCMFLYCFGGLVFADTGKHKRIGHAEILNFWTSINILIIS